MLPLTLENLRLFLHITAATVWVGGQLVLAALVPALRAAGPDVPRRAAVAFARIAWPAFLVLILTGLWNLYEVRHLAAGGYRGTLTAKIVVVVLSGATAALHERATTPRNRALFGAGTALFALLALLLGLQLAG